MRKLNLIFLALLCLVGTGCAAHTPAEKTALARTENVSLLDGEFLNQEVFVGIPCAVLPEARITVTKVDGISGKDFGLPGKDGIFVPPGKHTISVVVDTGTTVGHSTTHTSGRVTGSMGFSARVMMPEATLSFTLEEGKHYTLGYAAWGDLNIVLTEITDKARLAALTGDLAQKQAVNKEKAEITASYRDFARQNPRWLEGKWSVGPEKGDLELWATPSRTWPRKACSSAPGIR